LESNASEHVIAASENAIAASLKLEQGAVGTFKSSLLSKDGWVITAIFYVAENGLEYRRFRKGFITKD
jgi:hypothetical protein